MVPRPYNGRIKCSPVRGAGLAKPRLGGFLPFWDMFVGEGLCALPHLGTDNIRFLQYTVPPAAESCKPLSNHRRAGACSCRNTKPLLTKHPKRYIIKIQKARPQTVMPKRNIITKSNAICFGQLALLFYGYCQKQNN